jgi:stage V sporulation protein B
LALHLSPMMILGAYLLGSLAGAIVGWQFVKPLDRSTQVPAATFYRYALSLTIFLIVFPLFINLDVFLVKRFLPTGDEAGVYVAASTLGRMPFYLFTGLLLTLLPTVAHLKESAFDRLQQIVREVNRYTLLLLLPTVTLILATADGLMPLLFGSSYSGGGNILRLLIVGMSMLVLFRIATTVLAGITNPTKVVGMTVVMILANLGLNLLLIPSLGMLGAALASVLSSAFGLLMAIIQLRRHKLFILDWPSFRRAAIASLIAGALCLVHPSSVLLLPLLLAAGIVYLGLLFRFHEIQPKDRDRILSLLNRGQREQPVIETTET